MLATVVLLGLVLIATATDLRRHKIYNWTTYPGMLCALGLNALGELLERAGASERWRQWLGSIGFRDSVIGFLVCGGLMLVCFVLLKVGGGDVKLMAMLGAFLGWQLGISVMLWTFVLGSAAALIVLVWRVGPLRLAAQVLRHLLWMLRLGQWVPLTAAERAQLQPPLFLAPSALAAVVIVRFFNSFAGVT
jgi:Flp pilus assembly protein protease CpaA